MPETHAKPTPGAMRAAQLIKEMALVNFGGHNLPPSSIAAIIDRETGCKALAESLKALVEHFHAYENDLKEAERVLRAAGVELP